LQSILPAEAVCDVRDGHMCIEFPERFVKKREITPYVKGEKRKLVVKTSTPEPLVPTQPVVENTTDPLERYMDSTRAFVQTLREEISKELRKEAQDNANAFHQIPKDLKEVKLPSILIGTRVHFDTQGNIVIPLELLIELMKS